MIKRIFDKGQLILPNSHYGRKLNSLLRAYGTGYDFCKFYKFDDDYIGIYNGSMIITAENPDIEELSMFININSPDEIEVPKSLSEVLEIEGYAKIKRTLFEFTDGDFPDDMVVDENPKLDDVFKILVEGFPLKENYDSWLSDTSHRIRHGVSKCYLWNNTTATCHFIENNIAFFGFVATAESERGKGYARKLLYWINKKMSENGVKATLYAQEHRKSFYEGLGFKELYSDKYLKKEE